MSALSPKAFLAAARVPETLRPQSFGAWTIYRNAVPSNMQKFVGGATQTSLHRHTLATLHRGIGECVMEDSLSELQKHLPIWLAAHGRILVTGLGLGCVVRGLLAADVVENIDVIEIDPTIIAVVGPEFAVDPRVTIHCADALEFDFGQRRWDFAWHDLWTDEPSGAPKLQCIHAKLMVRCMPYITKRQGAWAFPREILKRVARAGHQVDILGCPRRARR
jgi:hypothetical protein